MFPGILGRTSLTKPRFAVTSAEVFIICPGVYTKDEHLNNFGSQTKKPSKSTSQKKKHLYNL